MGGGKRTRERALPKSFGPLQRASVLLCRGVMFRKNRALTPEGGGKRTVRGGRSKTPSGRGVIREVFLPPSFFHPPMASSEPIVFVLTLRQGERCKQTNEYCEPADPLQGSKSPKAGKEGFRVKKLPFPVTPEKGVLSPKIPISLQGTTRKMGIFGLKAPFLG